MHRRLFLARKSEDSESRQYSGVPVVGGSIMTFCSGFVPHIIVGFLFSLSHFGPPGRRCYAHNTHYSPAHTTTVRALGSFPRRRRLQKALWDAARERRTHRRTHVHARTHNRRRPQKTAVFLYNTQHTHTQRTGSIVSTPPPPLTRLAQSSTNFSNMLIAVEAFGVRTHDTHAHTHASVHHQRHHHLNLTSIMTAHSCGVIRSCVLSLWTPGVRGPPPKQAHQSLSRLSPRALGQKSKRILGKAVAPLDCIPVLSPTTLLRGLKFHWKVLIHCLLGPIKSRRRTPNLGCLPRASN